MAKITHPNSPPTARPLNSSFLRCFGFRRKVSSTDPDDKINNHASDHTKRPRHMITWFRSRMINKSPVRTVPLDHSADLSIDSAKTTTSRSSNSKFQEIRLVNDSPKSRTTWNRRHLESSKFETSKKRISFCRKADAIQPGSGQTGKPPPPHPLVSKPNAAPARHGATTGAIAQEIRVGSKEKHDQAALGMSIVIVTLVIMLIWGRLCAILCTSAWFYFCPRLRTLINHNNNYNDAKIIRKPSASAGLDLNSAEHKKRVVLEGFLLRNNNQHIYIDV